MTPLGLDQSLPDSSPPPQPVAADDDKRPAYSSAEKDKAVTTAVSQDVEVGVSSIEEDVHIRQVRRSSYGSAVPSSRGSAGSLEGSGSYGVKMKGVATRRRSSHFSFGKRASNAWSDVGSEAGRGSVASRRSSLAGSGLFSWTRMAKKDDLWEGLEGSEFSEEKLRDEVSFQISSTLKTIKRTVLTAVRTPNIMVITLLTLAILLFVGLFTIDKLADSYETQMKAEAVDTAEELGMWISRQLDEALLPLFTMSQFVQHLDTFKDLPYKIGPRGAEGSAPPLAGREDSHRNVTGICDDPDVLSVFTDIASSIKKDAGMEGILVNLQLAPQAVVCLLHPLINTEDFEDGVVMDNSKAFGHDLLNDVNRIAIARATIPADGVVTAGPLTLVQGDVPVVQEAFIARLAINMPGYKITLDGVDYPCWGFAVILLNWAALKKKSGIDEAFKREGLEYRLTRTDSVKDKVTGKFYDKVATIAESERSLVLNEGNSVSVDLPTTNNLWVMSVGYPDGFGAPWVKGVTAFVVILSVAVSILLMAVLVAKREMKNLLYNMMPPKIVRKLRKGQTVVERYDLATIFFSDIVGFTKLSGSMSPMDVMEMLNEMYTEFDKLVKKHNAFKVETIGDAYIVIGGGPDQCMGIEGAEKVALFALDALKFCEDFCANNGAQVRIRAGLSSGPVVAGVVGQMMPKFTLFGDTVNVASRMESTSTEMRVQCSGMTYRLLRDAPYHEFDLEERMSGNEKGVFIKGKGHAHTWWINGASLRTSDIITEEEPISPCALYDGNLGSDEKEKAKLDGDLKDEGGANGNGPNSRRSRSIAFEDEIEDADAGNEESVDSDGQICSSAKEKATDQDPYM